MATEPNKLNKNPGDPWASPAEQKPDAQRSRSGSLQRPGSVRGPHAVKITGVDIPFWSLVRFGLKLVVAAVPALLILLLVLVAIISLAGALVGTAIVAAVTELLTNVAQSVSWPW